MGGAVFLRFGGCNVLEAWGVMGGAVFLRIEACDNPAAWTHPSGPISSLALSPPEIRTGRRASSDT